MVECSLRIREVYGSNRPEADFKDFKKVLTASLCDAPHINEFEVNNASAYVVGLPDYAADLSVLILDRGRNAQEREIGSSIM